MLEITFDESTGGGLKCARACSDKLQSNILCFPLAADVGDISKPLIGEYRFELLRKLIFFDRWDDPEFSDEEDNLSEIYSKYFKKLKKSLSEGEAVRVWLDPLPQTVCGFLWLSAMLSKHGVEVFAVELPRFKEEPNVICERKGWGECEPVDFAEALAFQRKVSDMELRRNAAEWDRLVSENAPLRAVINGKVTSVPVSFYDFLIRRRLGDKPVQEAVLIGKVLGESQLGIGDWWLAYRIEHFIKQNKIVVIKDDKRKYARLIARA